MGRFPFPRWVRGKKGSKTPKKGPKYLQKGGGPQNALFTPFLRADFLAPFQGNETPDSQGANLYRY